MEGARRGGEEGRKRGRKGGREERRKGGKEGGKEGRGGEEEVGVAATTHGNVHVHVDMQALPFHNKTHTPTTDSSATLVGINKDGMNSSTDLPTISLEAANPNIHANQGSEDTRVPWRRVRRDEEV